MGGGDTGSSQQTTQVQLPEWVNQASQSNYGLAQKIAAKPYKAYGGQQVAGLPSEFTDASASLSGLDDYFGNYGQASQALSGLLGYTPNTITSRDVTAGSIPGMDLAKYVNPQTENIERRAIDNAERSGLLAQQGITSDATRKGAFGGSRQAIQQAVQGAETTRGIGDLSAKLRGDAYDRATGLMTSDLNRALTADTGNAERWQTAATDTEKFRQGGAAIQRGAATDLANVADQGQRAATNRIAQYLGIGGMKQDQQQRQLDSQKAQWQEKQNHDLESLNILMSALGMSPYGRTETTTKQSESSAGGGMAGILGMAVKAAPILMGMSDRSTKTNIEKVGVDPMLDLPIFAYDYKSDVETSKKTGKPLGMKRVGPMAQDVQKKYPKLVKKVGGKMVIDLTSLAA